MLGKSSFSKTIATVFVAFPMQINVASASDFKGVYDLTHSGEEMDLFIGSQILNRCAGLFGSLARFMPAGSEKDKLVLLSSKSLEKSYEVLTINRKSEAELIGQKMLSDIRYYDGIYETQMNLSQRDTGTIFSEWVEREVFFGARKRQKDCYATKKHTLPNSYQ